MIRKSCALLAVVSLLALPAIAQAGKSRTATGEYNTVIINPDEEAPSVSGQYSNGVEFKVRDGERFVSIVLEDKSGQPVRAMVGQDHDGDGSPDHEQEICGATTKPIKLMPKAPVLVYAQYGPCEDGTNAVGTFGTVTATFTR